MSQILSQHKNDDHIEFGSFSTQIVIAEKSTNLRDPVS